MHALFNIFNPEWWRFEWRYWRGQTPWDTNETPPEVEAFLDRSQPGRALDLGCGTGTNAITLTRRGWRVTGIDFSPKAIAAARRKATTAGLHIDFRIGDVTDLKHLQGPYDYALDIGCLFALKPDKREKYQTELARLLAPGGCYMLYAWLPRIRRGRIWGMTPEEVEALLSPAFKRTQMVLGEDGGKPSAWFWYLRT